jgi:hypothetical protein
MSPAAELEVLQEMEEPYIVTSPRMEFADDLNTGSGDAFFGTGENAADTDETQVESAVNRVVQSQVSEVLKWRSPRFAVAPGPPRVQVPEPPRVEEMANDDIERANRKRLEDQPLTDAERVSGLINRVLYWVVSISLVGSLSGIATYFAQSDGSRAGAVGWVVGIAGAGLAIEAFCGIIWLRARLRRRGLGRGQKPAAQA